MSRSVNEGKLNQGDKEDVIPPKFFSEGKEGDLFKCN